MGGGGERDAPCPVLRDWKQVLIAQCSFHIDQMLSGMCPVFICQFSMLAYTVLYNEFNTPCSGLSLNSAHCSVLTGRFSLLSAHCSVLTAQCSLLGSHCSVPTAQCSVLTAQCSLKKCLHNCVYCSVFSVRSGVLSSLLS